jgi:hypothetical protein
MIRTVLKIGLELLLPWHNQGISSAVPKDAALPRILMGDTPHA